MIACEKEKKRESESKYINKGYNYLFLVSSNLNYYLMGTLNCTTTTTTTTTTKY